MFTDWERALLCLRVPEILDEIDSDSANDRILAERAAEIGYGKDGIAHTPAALLNLLKVLGVLGPQGTEENLKLIGVRT